MAKRVRSLGRNGSLVSKKKFPPVVYGLEGIMSLFNISKSTAWRYRHSIIEEACTQNGNIIVVDVKKAFKLFGITNSDDLVSSQESQSGSGEDDGSVDVES